METIGEDREVNNDAQNILSITEKMFRHGTKNFVFRLNEVTLIFEAVQNIKLLSYYDKLCQKAEGFVDEKTSETLFEEIVGLFIRVRSHSYARNVKQKHKAKNNETKMHSL